MKFISFFLLVRVFYKCFRMNVAYFYSKKKNRCTSLTKEITGDFSDIQWLRISLPVQGIRVEP